MNVLITGSNGFLGKNLIEKLTSLNNEIVIYEFNSKSHLNELDDLLKKCDFIFHFAAVHRPKNPSEFDLVNHKLLSDILIKLEEYKNTCPVLYTSSIQALNGTDYGNSKLAAEYDLRNHAKLMKSRVIIYRLTNVFGKWSKPNSHSVVATFCYNISKDLPIKINNPELVLNFHYIDEVIESFIERFCEKLVVNDEIIYTLDKERTYSISLNELSQKIFSFRQCEINKIKPQLFDDFTRYLYMTYCYFKNID